MSRHLPLALVFAVLAAAPARLSAQPLLPGTAVSSGLRSTATQQISANPIGLLYDLFNFDYERRAREAVTIGIGGSTSLVNTFDEALDYSATPPPEVRRERYLNGDAYLRYYPSGTALDGFAVGVKIGLTRVPGQGSYFGYGVDVNRSRMLAEHFYFGYGVGLKRLVGADQRRFDVEYVPTVRLNLGLGF